jgi:hypothetical protein
MPAVTSNCWFCPYGVPTNTMPRWINGTSAVRIVVSWPPWMVAVLVKIPVALSSSSPLSQRPPRGVYKLLHLRAHVAVAGRRPPGDAVGPAQIVMRDHWNVGLRLLRPHISVLG